MFDDTSYKIIIELTQNARISNAKLAKKLHLSQSTVSKRIDKMIMDGVITIRTLPNPAKMGLQAGAFIGLKVASNKLDDICNRLKEEFQVNLVVTTFGRFDIFLMAYFQEWQEFHTFINEEIPGIDGINQIETYIISAMAQQHVSSPSGNIINYVSPREPEIISEDDRRLIKELLKESRPVYANLADKLGMSRSTVSRRINAMIKKEIIKFVAIPNLSKLGYSANGYVAIKANPAAVDRIYSQLSQYSEIHQIIKLMNGFNIIFGINCYTHKQLYEFVKNEISSIEGVLNTETFIVADFIHFNAYAMSKLFRRDSGN